MPNTTEEIMQDAGDIPAAGFFDPSTAEIAAAQLINVTRDTTTGKLYGVLLIEDIEASGYVSLTSPPSATSAGSDTTLTFSKQVNRVIIQNNTSANVNYAFDTAASAGSLVLAPGSTLIYPKKVTSPHLYTAAAQNINGTSAGNIVVLGAL